MKKHKPNWLFFLNNKGFADNVNVTAGSGTTIAADEVNEPTLGLSKVQFVKVMDGTLDSYNKMSVSSAGAVKVDGSAVTQPVSAASLPLPSGASTAANQTTGNSSLSSIDGKITACNTGAVVVSSSALPSGAATAAKQPALGTAGTPSSDVITVQGTTSMTALKVDGSAVTQPVSGSVSLSAVTPGTGASNLGKAEDAGHTTGDVGVMALAVRQDANTTLAGTDLDYAPLQVDATGSLKVSIISGAGSGGTAMADDAAFTPAVTNITPAGGTYRSVRDAIDDNDGGAIAITQKRAVLTCVETPTGDSAMDDTNDAVRVNIVAGAAAGGTSITDDSPFTVASSALTPAGGTYKVTRDAVDDGDAGAFAMTAKRALLGCIETPNGDTAMDDTNDAVRVNIVAGAAAGGTSITDDSAFTVASSALTPAGGTYKSVRDAVDDGDAGAFAMNAKRAMYVSLETPNSDSVLDDTLDAVKVVNATATNLKVDASGVAVPITDNSGSITVDNAGTFAVQATVAAGATNIAKAEDVASADADVGVPAMAVRKATPANTSGTDGDYEMLQMSAGRLWTSATIDAALPAGTNGIGKLTSNSGVTIGAVEIAASQTLSTVTTVSTVTNQSQEGGVNISLNAGAVDTGTRRVVQANGAGKTILSASGSASTSGNNTLVAAGSNKLKVFAFTLSTTSTTAVTCKFQSGASGTDLWSVILQAPTSVSTGANLSVSPPAWLFATASATLLNLNLSSANAVQWSVSYFDEA